MSKQGSPQFLIVDDFSSMRRIIRGLLKDAGYVDADEAEDGQVAFQKLQAGHFDCVITDINMPNMNGFELLEAIKEDEKLKSTPVLMITAEAGKDNVIKAAKLGACAYIVKPFSKAILEDKIHKLFKRKVH
ncbi:response regulator [Limnohabitans sp. DM1]|uniref:response regulator n=1 Tax=Limnohabitans sp. DM1 TaxID=1597955 RepID=UPI000AD7B962|nr:response regulator [Limnohabitans sp. DM1]